jgi:type IV secretory pathway VirB6-like protein
MIKYIIITLLTILLASCGEPDCIDANDFGEPKVLLNPQGEYIEPRIEDNNDFNFLEVTKSTYTGHSLNGEELRIVVSGAWSPWSEQELKNYMYSCHSDYISNDDGKTPIELVNKVKQRVCKEDRDFTPSSAEGFVGHKFEQIIECDNNTFQNNLCWFPYGWGVMIGFSKDPEFGKEYLIHLGPRMRTEGRKKVARIRMDELVRIKSSLSVSDWGSIKIYLRVHDNNYSDNVNGCIKKDIDGSYPKLEPEDGDIYFCNKPMQFIFTDGVYNDKPGFLEGAAQAFLDPSEKLIESFYQAFINSSNYKNIFYLCSVLFVVLLPIGFFTAYLQLSLQQLTVIIIRFAIISTLLSPNGWDFFDKYVKSFFWNGSNNLAKLIVDTTKLSVSDKTSTIDIRIGSTIDSSVLRSADDSLEMLFSSAVNSKLMALMFSHKFGILIIIAMYFAFYIFIFSILKLAVILIFLFISMSILLSIAPVFLIFALFQYTREQYFEKWLQALISVSLQPMMLFTFFGLFLVVVNSYLHDMLYFEACWKTLINLLIIKLKFWKVNQAYGPADPVTGTREMIDGTPRVEFIDILLLFLSAMVIRYVTEKVPEISEKIAGGFSLGAINDIVNKTISGVEKFGEEFTKATAGSIWERTGGKALSKAVDKYAPSVISKHAHKLSFGLINKTKTAQLASAKKSLEAKLKAKGWNKKGIDEAMKSGKLDKKLSKELMKEKARSKRYGLDTKNPFKIGVGALRQLQDNIKNSAVIAASGNMSSKQKRKLKEGNYASEMKKLGSGKDTEAMEKINKQAEELIDNKFGKVDLMDTAKEIKEEMNKNGDKISSKENIENEIRERMMEKGYSQEKVDALLDNDKKSKNSTMDKIFGEEYEDAPDYDPEEDDYDYENEESDDDDDDSFSEVSDDDSFSEVSDDDSDSEISDNDDSDSEISDNDDSDSEISDNDDSEINEDRNNPRNNESN